MSKVMNWMMDMEEYTIDAAEIVLSEVENVTSKVAILSSVVAHVSSRMDVVDENFIKEYFEANIDDWRFEFNSKYI
tara:strand:+ start:465 stop:692 length:228 start_codon:yes stop_codon:yes gene_type:complete